MPMISPLPVEFLLHRSLRAHHHPIRKTPFYFIQRMLSLSASRFISWCRYEPPRPLLIEISRVDSPESKAR